MCEPFQRLIESKELMAYKYDGFWACMDTFKEQQQLDDMYSQSKAPWEVWKFSNKVTKKHKILAALWGLYSIQFRLIVPTSQFLLLPGAVSPL